MTTIDINLDHLTEMVFVRFFTVKLLFSPISILYSLEGSHYGQPTLKKWLVMLYLLEGILSTNVI